MIIGETICAVNAAATTVYSPWFPRQGNAATFVLEVIAEANSAKVEVTVQTKNSEDADPGTSAAGTSFSQSGAGTKKNRNYNFKELVRFKVEVSTTVIGTVAWAHFRMLNPAWETN